MRDRLYIVVPSFFACLLLLLLPKNHMFIAFIHVKMIRWSLPVQLRIHPTNLETCSKHLLT